MNDRATISIHAKDLANVIASLEEVIKECTKSRDNLSNRQFKNEKVREYVKNWYVITIEELNKELKLMKSMQTQA